MREILFRGFHPYENGSMNGEKIKGEWVYGDLRRLPKGLVLIKSIDNFGTADVLPETVGQCTGLTDKNGNKWEVE